jgi:acyl carrier protein
MNQKNAELIIKKKIKISKQIYDNLDSLGKMKILIEIEKKLKIQLNSNEINLIFSSNYKNFTKELISIFYKKFI